MELEMTRPDAECLAGVEFSSLGRSTESVEVSIIAAKVDAGW